MRKDDLDRIEKCVAISLTLLLTLTVCGPAVAQSPVIKANGPFANAFGCSESQTSIECLSVSVTTAGLTAPFLFYEDSVSDLNTGFLLQDTTGFGNIPNNTFQVHGQTDSLNVDTSTMGSVFQTFCTFDPNSIPTCNPISGGVVTGTWTVITNLDSTHSSGASRQIFPNAIFIANGTSDSQAGLANVNVLGVALTNVIGQVGKQSNTTISVQVRH